MGLFLLGWWKQVLCFIFIYLQKKKKKKVERGRGKNYIFVTLWGVEPSQVTPFCPHKLFPTSQLKLPLLVKELYQFTKIVWSSTGGTPFQKVIFERKGKKKRKKSKKKKTLIFCSGIIIRANERVIRNWTSPRIISKISMKFKINMISIPFGENLI